MTKPKPGDFGRWIKARRRELGLGRYRCAGRASIGGEALRLIECGRTCPSLCKVGTLYGLAKVLELDIVEVMERAAQENRRLIETLEWAKEYM